MGNGKQMPLKLCKKLVGINQVLTKINQPFYSTNLSFYIILCISIISIIPLFTIIINSSIIDFDFTLLKNSQFLEYTKNSLIILFFVLFLSSCHQTCSCTACCRCRYYKTLLQDSSCIHYHEQSQPEQAFIYKAGQQIQLSFKLIYCLNSDLAS